MRADGRDAARPEQAGQMKPSRRWIAARRPPCAPPSAPASATPGACSKPLAAEFGWSAADVSLSFTALLGAGRHRQHHRRQGAAVREAAHRHPRRRRALRDRPACLGSVHSLAGVYAFSFLAGFGMGSVYPGGTMTNVIRFFPDRRGMASGILTAGYGVGGVVCAPLAASHRPLRAHRTLRVLGVVFFVAIALSSRHRAHGPRALRPRGAARRRAGSRGDARAADLDWRGMLRTPDFYVLVLPSSWPARSPA